MKFPSPSTPKLALSPKYTRWLTLFIGLVCTGALAPAILCGFLAYFVWLAVLLGWQLADALVGWVTE